MKMRKIMKVLAAMFAGSMLMLPATALAARCPGYTLASDVEAVSNFSVVVDGDNVLARWSNTLDDAELIMECSSDPSFPDNEKTEWYTCYSGNVSNLIYSIDFEPGHTYYVRAHIRIFKMYDPEEGLGGGRYISGPYTNTQKVTFPVPKVRFGEQKVTDSSVYFSFEYDNVTGYEIYRASGTKFKKIAKISDTVYTDSGLKSATTYNYMARAYVYEPSTKKTTYGAWSYAHYTTWGQSLHLLAEPVDKNSVKLTWKKVSGASGYEIYRRVGSSSALLLEDGSDPDFDAYKLIKTITDGKTFKYTDKKLIAGMGYTYVVVAYRNKAGKKDRDLMIYETSSALLDMDFSIYSTVRKKDGGLQLKWKKVIGASGIKIMKRDKKSGDLKTYKELKPSATSVTLPKSSSVDGYDSYQIYAYRGSKSAYPKDYDDDDYYTYNFAMVSDAPGSVTARAASGGTAVKVSWKPVRGAAYYQVYRSRCFTGYQSDLGCYRGYDWEETVRIKAGVSDGTTQIKTTSVTDQYLEYRDSDGNTHILNKGPQPGLVYYYYVQAYKSNGKPVGSDDYKTYESWSDKPARIILNPGAAKAPKLSGVKSKKAKQAVVSWKKAAGAKKYYIYCSTQKGKGYQLAGTTTKTSFTVKGLKSGKTYYFKVKSYATNAVGADYFSGDSSEKSVKVK